MKHYFIDFKVKLKFFYKKKLQFLLISDMVTIIN